MGRDAANRIGLRQLAEDPRLTSLAVALPASVPFKGPEAQERERGAPFDARIGANESVFGPSPLAIAAMERAARDAWMYADPEAYDLKRSLAGHHGIDPGHIAIGEGIDGLLGLLVRLTVAAGEAVVTSDGAYPTFNYHVVGYGGVLHKVPYVDDREDPDSLVAKARETRAKLIYLANPDNPMGSWHDSSAVEQLIKRIPPRCLLVLDEAYGEFAPEGTNPPLRPTEARVVRMRTFSKAYGLAGARVGYAIGPAPLIKAFDKVRNHFGMSRVGIAGALASLEDGEWLEVVREKAANSRAAIAAVARENGLDPLPSATNFVAIDCGADGSFARRVLSNLVDAGVFVRMPFVSPQDRCIRVSCGTEPDIEFFREALPAALEEARNWSGPQA